MTGKGRFPFFSLVVVAALLPVLAGPAAAQTGDVRGQVRSGDGQALPGITVKLLRAGSQDSLEKASDAQGRFHFDDLKDGVYVVTTSHDGYAPVTCPGARIVRGMTKQFDLKLMPDGGEPSTCAAAPAS
ncbi:MAG TPA: carboxypeptidase-like regulatory domain-containing protein [Thermoanaerobaculia bacterium]|nr:carboxypeptidase-like regulatory domain-containing protein [Thermoanaerobaculia bacterium]